LEITKPTSLLTVEYALSREQDLIGLYRFESCPDYRVPYII
jgi:hypothetical protein